MAVFGRRNSQLTPVVLLVLGVCFFMFMMLSSDVNKSLFGRLSELENHLEHIRFMDKEKAKVIQEMRAALSGRSLTNGGGGLDSAGSWYSDSANGTAPGARNRTAGNGTLFADIAVPNIYDWLPHLLNVPNVNALQPSLRLASGYRRNYDYVIGIPTVPREKMSYLHTTLQSLIDNLRPEEFKQVLIVVFLADMRGSVSPWVQEQTQAISSEFKRAIDNGYLEVISPSPDSYPELDRIPSTFIERNNIIGYLDTVISPSPDYYPELDTIPSTFDDPPERMRWRTKQNLDYAYLMMYCQRRGRYYLQLEDDVITKPDYISMMHTYIMQHSSQQWLMLEFSSLGFIGKMFKTSELPLIVQFILLFYREKPVDWLLDHVFTTRYCSPEKSAKICQKTKKQFAFRRKPSIFQHIGVHSSLKGKVQKLKEKDFGKPVMHRPHADNPPAKVSTSLKIYQKFSLEACYSGNNYFWGLLPQENDWVQFELVTPARIESLLFRSGNFEHPDDKFYNSTLEVSVVDDKVSSDELLYTMPSYVDQKSSIRWYTVAEFGQNGQAYAQLNSTALIRVVRIVVHTESATWAILSEVWIRLLSL